MADIIELVAAGTDERVLQARHAASQQRWSRFKDLMPRGGAGTKGTLFWEFAKSICQEFNDMNPAVAMMLSMRAAGTFEALNDTFKELR